MRAGKTTIWPTNVRVRKSTASGDAFGKRVANDFFLQNGRALGIDNTRSVMMIS